MRWLFSRGFWKTFGSRLFATFFSPTTLRYNFGYGSKDVRVVARYWRDPYLAPVLRAVIDEHNLKGPTDYITVKKVMTWLQKTYPSSKYYTPDRGERWNDPVDTLRSFQARANGVKTSITTDCDDYAILIYNLCRAAGVDVNNLWLCIMKTITEWHLNVMYVHDGVPYAVEGTYYPYLAKRNFGAVPYFSNAVIKQNRKVYYYEKVRYRWNEKTVQKWSGRINPEL